MTKHTEFHWYASANAETYTIEAESRDAVIAAATAERMGEEVDEDGKPRLFFYIVEASKFYLRIGDYAVPSDEEELFEMIEENAAQWDFGNLDGGGDDIFPCGDGVRKDLLQRLKATCEQWQADHNLSWRSWVFAMSRNEETIVVSLDPEGGEA